MKLFEIAAAKELKSSDVSVTVLKNEDLPAGIGYTILHADPKQLKPDPRKR